MFGWNSRFRDRIGTVRTRLFQFEVYYPPIGHWGASDLVGMDDTDPPERGVGEKYIRALERELVDLKLMSLPTPTPTCCINMIMVINGGLGWLLLSLAGRRIPIKNLSPLSDRFPSTQMRANPPNPHPSPSQDQRISTVPMLSAITDSAHLSTTRHS